MVGDRPNGSYFEGKVIKNALNGFDREQNIRPPIYWLFRQQTT